MDQRLGQRGADAARPAEREVDPAVDKGWYGCAQAVSLRDLEHGPAHQGAQLSSDDASGEAFGDDVDPQPRSGTVHGIKQLLGVAEQLSSTPYELLAWRGQANATPVPLEELGADAFLEVVDLRGEGLLGDVESRCRTRLVQLLCEDDRVAHQAQIQVHGATLGDRARALNGPCGPSSRSRLKRGLAAQLPRMAVTGDWKECWTSQLTPA
jgi:hypothetical protein